MRGIADTAYTLKFMWQVGIVRGIQLYLQMLEAHLLPFLVINTMVSNQRRQAVGFVT